MEFVQELQVQAMGASAEFGNFQGGVVNIITKSGSDRLMFGASFYRQPAA
jgi:outer membrane receptor protein involved in Fe transport